MIGRGSGSGVLVEILIELLSGILQNDGNVSVPWEKFGIFECSYDPVAPVQYGRPRGRQIGLNRKTGRVSRCNGAAVWSLCHALIGMDSALVCFWNA